MFGYPMDDKILGETATERLLCETRLDYLCSIVLGMKDWDKCHSEYMEWDTGQDGKRFRLIMMPRGHLKSSIITIGKTIQDILKDPNTTILIASAVWGNARSFLSEIKEYLEKNEILRRLYGRFDAARWNSDEIIVRQRTRPNKTPSVDTAGVEKTMTSQHYQKIRCDDLVTRENITTPEQMDKVENFLKDSIKLLEPNGILEVVGTRWHDADLYGQILRKMCGPELGNDAFVVYKRQAVENGQPIFPKKFSPETVKSIRAQIGSYEWAANYMNDPVDPENQKFPPPIRYWKDGLGENAVHTITVDPAISEKKDSCDAVVMDCAITGSNQLCVVEYAALKEKDKTPAKVIEKIFEFVLKYPNRSKAKLVGIESNGYQAALCRLLEEEMRKRNVFFEIVEIRQNRDKMLRILELTPRWESGNLLLKEGMIELEEQILRFPVSQKLDILDTLAMQLQIAQPQLERKAKIWIPPQYRAVA